MNSEPTTDIVRYFRVDRRDLVYLKFILEAYEGMSTLSTVEKSGAIVSLTVPAGFADDMAQLIGALQSEITLAECARPDSLPKDPRAHA
ncbi:MAG TPA: DUF4911 domain-containing protein [Geobacteraceae bacterium]|nr:DUF4911 domain-containing protein [Geobacteraceae bacterium]